MDGGRAESGLRTARPSFNSTQEQQHPLGSLLAAPPWKWSAMCTPRLQSSTTPHGPVHVFLLSSSWGHGGLGHLPWGWGTTNTQGDLGPGLGTRPHHLHHLHLPEGPSCS